MKILLLTSSKIDLQVYKCNHILKNLISIADTEMSSTDKRAYIRLLSTLKKLKPENQSNIIEFLNEPALNLIGEVFHNVIGNDLKLSKKSKQILKKRIPGNEKIIKFVAKKSNSPEKQRKKLMQTGNENVLLISTYCLFSFRKEKDIP